MTVEFSSGLSTVVGLQTAFVTLVLALVLAHAFLRRRSLDGMDSLLMIWALATWGLPLSQELSVQRGQAALLPLAVLVARLPSRLARSLVVPAAAIAVWMESYFLDGTLI